MKKRMLLLAVLLTVTLALCGCNAGSLEGTAYEKQLFGAYQSVKDGTVMSFDSVLFYLTEDDVYIMNYKYNPNTGELFLGDKTFTYAFSNGRKTLQIGSDEYESIGLSLGMTWRIFKACAEVYIGQNGVFGWLLSPMIYQGTNTLGIYGIGAAALVDVGIVVAIILICVLWSKIANRDRKSNRRR